MMKVEFSTPQTAPKWENKRANRTSKL